MIRVLPRREELTAIWRQRIEEAAESSMSIKDWCLQNGVGLSRFYYWNHRLRALEAEAAASTGSDCATGLVQIQPERIREFGPLEAVSHQWLCVEPVSETVRPHRDCLTIRVSGAEIDVHTGFNAALLRSIVKALGVDPC